MAKSPVALVESSLLIWARESAGLSREDVGEKLNPNRVDLQVDKVRSWESDDSRPSVSQLRRLAALYKRPLAVFFLQEPPIDFMPVRDYRRLADHSAPDEISAKLRAELRRVIEIQDAAISLLDDRNVTDYREFPIQGTMRDRPDALAERLRDALDVDAEQQFQWPDPFSALREWRAAAEDLGVLVTQASGVELSEMRGFSLTDSRLPLICINASDTANGRIFTLMHELTHIALSEGGLCEWEHPQDQSPDNKQVEVFCNNVAGALLVPEAELLRVPVVRDTRGLRNWSNDELRTLARRFCVSREVILRRLLICNRATEQFYRRKRQELLDEYRSMGRQRPFPVPYEKRVANALGHGFIEIVLDSYHERHLSLSAASSLLGVRIRHLHAIEHEVMGWSHIATASQ